MNRKIASNLFKLVTGPSLGHVMTILITPFLAHHYSPKDFGDLAFLVALVAVFSVFSCLRFDAVLLACEDDEVNSSVTIGFSFLFLVSSLAFIASLFSEYEFSIELFISLSSISFVNLVNSYHLRFGRYGAISIVKFIQSSSVPIFQLFSCVVNLEHGLIYAYVFASVVTAVLYLMFSYNTLTFGRCSYCIVSKYSGFVYQNSLSVLVNAISAQFLPLTLGLVAGKEFLGIVSFLNRVVVLPCLFILRLVIQVYNSEFSNKIRNNEIESARKLYATFSIVPGILCMLYALSAYVMINYLIGYFVDDIWRNSLILLPPILMLLLFQGFTIPISQSLSFLNGHNKQLTIELFRLGFLTFMFTLYYYALQDIADGVDYIYTYTVIMTLYYIVMHIFIRRSIYKGVLA